MRRECSVALMFIVDAAGQTPDLSVGGSGAVRIRCCVWNSKSSSVVATSLFLTVYIMFEIIGISYS